MVKERVVIKIGTSRLTLKDGRLNSSFLKEVAKDVKVLLSEGKDVVIVSSGAIGLGSHELGISRPRDIKVRQAAAAVGQTALMQAWRDVFGKQPVAQLLLTYDSFQNRKTYVNLNNSLEELLRLGVVPIINENDPISIDEIDASFGDNDKMSALVASKIEADLLIIVSDIDGLYTRNPKLNKDAELISRVEEITESIEKMGHKASASGTGGMKSKIEAAKICRNAGVYMVITDKGIVDIARGRQVGTVFIPKQKLSHKQRWIEFSPVHGKVVVDAGAKKAVLSGKTLLAAGVVSVEGVFRKKDVVELVCSGSAFAKVMVEMSSKELDSIKGVSGKGNVFSKENVVVF